MSQHFLYLLLGSELPLMVESFGLLNELFPFPSILDAAYPVFNLNLANILFNVILPSVLGLPCDLLVRGFHLNNFLTLSSPVMPYGIMLFICS